MRTSVADEQECWRLYCQMEQARLPKPSVEALLLAHWDRVFSLLDPAGHAEKQADADAVEFVGLALVF